MADPHQSSTQAEVAGEREHSAEEVGGGYVVGQLDSVQEGLGKPRPNARTGCQARPNAVRPPIRWMLVIAADLTSTPILSP